MRLKRNDEVTVSELRDIFDVDFEVGKLRWKKISTQPNHVKVGDEAGWKATQGYLSVCIKGKQYRVHRIIWALYHGEFPEQDIDHINRITNDNRISNLRLATRSENMINRGRFKNNTSGIPGVAWHSAAKKWTANLGLNGKRIHLGCFSDKNDAVEARRKAERMYYDEFAAAI